VGREPVLRAAFRTPGTPPRHGSQGCLDSCWPDCPVPRYRVADPETTPPRSGIRHQLRYAIPWRSPRYFPMLTPSA
jgi:hypothetical protein